MAANLADRLAALEKSVAALRLRVAHLEVATGNIADATLADLPADEVQAITGQPPTPTAAAAPAKKGNE